jgi:glycosyltransferase involved in cell wall biosynthesis
LNPNTVIIPTPIDLGQFRRSFPYRDHAPVVIGWIGHRKNLENLHDLDGVIENLLGEDERITFRIVSDGRFAIDAVKPDRIQSVLWSLDREVEMVAGFDIGIMPLRDNPWNQGKCAYKLLEYMALELPTVSSPVGVNQEIVRDAENGFLAASPDEWEEKLRRLVDDFALREQIGKAARASLADYALEANVPKLMSVFERAMSSRRASWVAP